MSAEAMRRAAAAIRTNEKSGAWLDVAEWLEMVADYSDLAVDRRHPGWRASEHHALVVARAYLGESVA